MTSKLEERKKRRIRSVTNYRDCIFPSDDDDLLGFPTLQPALSRDWQGLKLVDYGARVRYYDKSVCHFFVNDARFESLINAPAKSLSHVLRYAAVLTPDYSIFADYPLSLQIAQHYKSRWLGAYWQSQGVNVVPTLAWGGADSLSFAFSGLPKEAVLAVAAPSQRAAPAQLKRYLVGFSHALEVLRPRVLLVSGLWLPDYAIHLLNTIDCETWINPTPIDKRNIERNALKRACEAV